MNKLCKEPGCIYFARYGKSRCYRHDLDYRNNWSRQHRKRRTTTVAPPAAPAPLTAAGGG